MKTTYTSKSVGQGQTAGFTLIEMIGVLAVIAILAGMLVPKVEQAISDSKVNGTISSYQTVSTAVANHYGQYNSLNSVFGTNATTAQLTSFDTSVLLPEGLLDKPFVSKIGSGAVVQVVPGSTCNGGQGYFLSGSGSTNAAAASTASMAYVAELVISNVAPQDAYDISTRLDGTSLTPTTVGATDFAGRVNWATNTGNLYVYITGR